MTREEALKIIKRWLLNGTAGLTKDRLGYIEEWVHKEDAEAFEMAIKALEEQETVLEKLIKIRAEIEMLPTTLITVYRPNSTVERNAVELGSVLRVFDKYK